ncbi:MAG: OB-fold nucleic acid binding domain-containing protein [Acidobacteria bacterium]|nr:OB-fold nucleic acid binding domain-containing protein [Acidobacteriota bacterium]
MRMTFFLAACSLVLTTAACKPAASTNAPAATTAPAAQQQSAAPASAAGPAAAPAAGVENAFTGTIAETMDSGGYTYARLEGGGKNDVWIAAPQFDAKVGEQVSVALDMPMPGFQSKTLNRTFPTLYFVQDVARNGQPLAGGNRPSAPALMTGHGSSGNGGSSTAAPSVQKLEPPAGGLSVADVFAKKDSLSGKSVTVRGTVVKFNGGIMDRNWLHIQDGSGSATAKNNDLTITTNADVKVGDVVIMTGVVGTNKDFGYGYAYDVMLEKATLK